MAPGENAREVFENIYESEHWERGSGQGSRSAVTHVYRAILERLVGSPDIRTVVDAGCGDWEFSAFVDWSKVSYLGLDVVPALIERNRAAFSAPNIAFSCVDLGYEAPPRADLLLCKDVLQHWPVEWVRRFLRRIPGRYRYALLTNDVDSVHCPATSLNAPIPLGAWRTLDLESPPFNVRPAWRLDYDIRGEWTKRVLLLASGRHTLRARLDPGSALNRLRRHDWTAPAQTG